MINLPLNIPDEEMHHEAEIRASTVHNLTEEELLNFISYSDNHEYTDIVNQ